MLDVFTFHFVSLMTVVLLLYKLCLNAFVVKQNDIRFNDLKEKEQLP